MERKILFGALLFSVLILVQAVSAAGPAIVNLGSAGNFAVLAQTGISNTGTSAISGDIGVSPAEATSMTGFTLVSDPSNVFATSSLVTGKVYAANYAPPTPVNLGIAVGDMQAAYTNADGVTTPAPIVNTGSGILSGLTLVPGVYSFDTGVTIPSSITLACGGDSSSVFIFQIAGTLGISANQKVILSGGCQASNIFWAAAGETTLEPGSIFQGNILDKTGIAIQTGATLNGRALAQSAVTLESNTIVMPTFLSLIGNSSDINTTLANVTVTINGTNATNATTVNTTAPVIVSSKGLPVLSFNYNFTLNPLNFSAITINNGSRAGATFLVVDGVNTTGAQVGAKTFYLYNVSTSFNGICIQNVENATVPSQTCSNPGEYALLCNGVVRSGVTCTKSDGNTTLTVSGLQNSGVAQLQVGVSPPAVSLGTAGDYAALAQTGVSTTGTTSIVGNIGISPAAASFITGFGLIADPSGQFSTSSLVTGRIYAANYATPTPTLLGVAIGDMQTAYTAAAGAPAGVGPFLNAGAGTLSGLTLIPGVYTWGTGVTIPSDLTLDCQGNSSAVFIFQIAQTLTVGNGVQIVLIGGCQASNIFWQAAGQTTVGTTSVFNGNILDQTGIAIQTGAVLNGRALAQTAVTMDGNAVTVPTMPVQGPTIINLAAAAVSTYGATFTWSTDENASGTLFYSTDPNFNASITMNSSVNSSLSQSVQILSLSAGTQYYYYVVACSNGLCNQSANQSISIPSSSGSSGGSGGSGGSTGGGGSSYCVGPDCTTTTSASTTSSTSQSSTTTTRAPVASQTLQVTGQATSEGASGTIPTGSASALESVQVTLPTNPSGVYQVDLTPSSGYSGEGFTVSSTLLGSYLPTGVDSAPPGAVINYVDVSDDGIPVANATVYFSLTPSELANVNPTSVVLYGYSGGAWTALPTTYLGNGRFSAVAPEPSVFAIVNTNPQPSANNTLTPSTTGANSPLGASAATGLFALNTDDYAGIILVVGIILIAGGWYYYSKPNA
jgi:PGF-pre-PGF domain-containing protein